MRRRGLAAAGAAPRRRAGGAARARRPEGRRGRARARSAPGARPAAPVARRRCTDRSCATSANATRSRPRTVMAGWRRPRRRGEEPGQRTHEGEVARALAVRRGRAPSTRRTSSASSPTPALNVKRRPLTRPSEMLRSRCRAGKEPGGLTGSRGSPSARGSTLVPPPGRKPTATSSSTPLTTSLNAPSPPRT